MKVLALAFALAASSQTPAALDWITHNRPTALTWKSFDPAVVKAMKGKADSIGVVLGHFYSENFTDAAVLSKQDSHLIFEIIKCNPACVVDIHQDITAGMEGTRFVAKGLTYLTLVPKGELVETSPAIEGENKHVKLEHDGIQVATFEKSAVVWYWDGKTNKWDTVSTTD